MYPVVPLCVQSWNVMSPVVDSSLELVGPVLIADQFPPGMYGTAEGLMSRLQFGLYRSPGAVECTMS
jgi:hypothetical protein